MQDLGSSKYVTDIAFFGNIQYPEHNTKVIVTFGDNPDVTKNTSYYD
jgi:hypothetical protein